MAAKLSTIAEQYTSEISLEFRDKSMRMDSLIGLISIEFHRGEDICVVASGDDEEAAASANCGMLADADF